jgi:hypothetical protein
MSKVNFWPSLRSSSNRPWYPKVCNPAIWMVVNKGRSFTGRWIGLSDCPGARLGSSRFPMVLHLRSPVARDGQHTGAIDATQGRIEQGASSILRGAAKSSS